MIRIISDSSERFKDRHEAGRLLADALKDFAGDKVVVLGIPRGGVIVAAEVARSLNAELDVVFSRKLGAPINPELAIGAIGEGGKLFLNENLASRVGATEAYIKDEKARQTGEIKERSRKFRQVQAKVNLKGKTVIVTDDGIATGATMQAALSVIRQEKPKKLIVAAPVASQESAEALSDYADGVIVLRAPEALFAIGHFYAHFDQVSDEEVVRVLKEAVRDRERSYEKPNNGIKGDQTQGFDPRRQGRS
jgi:predicted phosphoribosyltransferase